MADKDGILISLLQENARMPVSEIARRMGVSRTAAQVRLEKLERSGTVTGYTVKLSDNYRRDKVRAVVMIKSPPRDRPRIESELAQIPELSSLYSISGIFDLSAIISTVSVEDLDRVIDHIGRIDGVVETQSSIILSTKIER